MSAAAEGANLPGADLVLGSASPARLLTLQRAGLSPFVLVSGVDEDAELERALASYGSLGPDEVPLVLARAKAEAVARLIEQGQAPADSADVPPAPVVLGCDSVLELDGEVHGKPADAAQATERWRRMRGRTGILHTGHWVIDLRENGSGATLGAVASTTVHFADVSDAEIDAYVATGEPLQVAGAFTTDGLGGAFVSGIEGDHHNVVGVSLPLLRELLADCDITWTDLWARGA
ncbi:MAG TPA: Maf family protein [Actinomycetales bacterium]|jgi:septum formation protein